MTVGRSFEGAFIEFTVASGRWRDTSPAELLARWERLVSECEDGYPSDAEDYFNDLTSRDAIERALRNEELSRYSEMVAFRQQVARIDARFRVLLRPDAFPRLPAEDWWARGIVRSAGQRLVNDLRDDYGVVIDVITESHGRSGSV